MKTLISSFFFILQLICIPTSDAQTINRTRLQSRTGPSQIKRDYNGICGLKQSSGWFSMSEAKTSGKMFFWLFDAQVETPKDAPLLLWLQGGPGGAIAPSVLSSHGPCQLDASGKLQKSDWALNKFANVLYVEQPLGTGFSTNDGDTVSTDEQALATLWEFLGFFLEKFPEYQNHGFNIVTPSYGGHGGPLLAKKMDDASKDPGSSDGAIPKLASLTLITPLLDIIVQSKAALDYLHTNPTRQVLNDEAYKKKLHEYTNDVVPAWKKCDVTNSDADCANAATKALDLTAVPGNMETDIRFKTQDEQNASPGKKAEQAAIAYINSNHDLQKFIQVPKVGDIKAFYSNIFDLFEKSGSLARTTNLLALKSLIPTYPITIFSAEYDIDTSPSGIESTLSAVTGDKITFSPTNLHPVTIGNQAVGAGAAWGKMSYLRVDGVAHGLRGEGASPEMYAYLIRRSIEGVSFFAERGR